MTDVIYLRIDPGIPSELEYHFDDSPVGMMPVFQRVDLFFSAFFTYSNAGKHNS